MGKEVFETTQRALERDLAWIPDNPEFAVVSTKQKKRIGCMLPWTETMINWDGSVLPCCAVYSEKYAFGNILENSFKEIWNNEMYVSARKEILGELQTIDKQFAIFAKAADICMEDSSIYDLGFWI